jgi:hypothetical protein
VNDFLYLGGQMNVENLAGNQVSARVARRHIFKPKPRFGSIL